MTKSTMRSLTEQDVDAATEILVAANGEMRRPEIYSCLTASGAEPYRALVVEDNNAVIAVAVLCAAPRYPGFAAAMAAVAEGHRGEGIGTKLVTALFDAAASTTGPQMKTLLSLGDNQEAGRRFAERFGFRLLSHSYGWRIPLAGRADELTELARKAADRANVRTMVTTLAENAQMATDIVTRSIVSMPTADGATVDIAASRDMVPVDAPLVMAFPRTPADATAQAISVIGPVGKTSDWLTMFTGVDPAHRGRGFARAVKTAALAHAAKTGAGAMLTQNDTENGPILAINKDLGMERYEGFWVLVRDGADCRPTPAPSQ